MDGFISYPRTDNTVYPNSLPVRELLQSIAQVDAFKEAAPIAARPELEPTRGKKQTTDHPPIYPTQALDPKVLPDDGHRKIYELVVRRFLATFADPAVSESTRADIEAGDRDLLRARQRAGRARLPRGLSVRALEGRGDPEGRGGPGAAARARPVVRREGDAAAVADRPGQADRDDGGARPRHEGDAPRHHPEALRPRLRPEQPDRALGDRDRDGEGVPEVRRADRDAGHDGRARGGHGQDRLRRGHQGPGRRRSRARCCTSPTT